MKSNQVRQEWRDVLDHVKAGGQVVIEHYNRPVARIVPFEEPAVETEPREIDIAPAEIVRLDVREEWDPATGRVRQRMTVGTTPDGTPVLLAEAPAPTDYPTGAGWPKLAERRGYTIWAFDSVEAARQSRDEQITRGYQTPDEIAQHIRDVTDELAEQTAVTDADERERREWEHQTARDRAEFEARLKPAREIGEGYQMAEWPGTGRWHLVYQGQQIGYAVRAGRGSSRWEAHAAAGHVIPGSRGHRTRRDALAEIAAHHQRMTKANRR